MALPPTASLHGLMVPSIVGFRGCQSPRKPEPVRKNPVPRRGTRPCLPKASPHRNVDRAAIVRAFPARHAGRPISLCTASETRQPATTARSSVFDQTPNSHGTCFRTDASLSVAFDVRHYSAADFRIPRQTMAAVPSRYTFNASGPRVKDHDAISIRRVQGLGTRAGPRDSTCAATTVPAATGGKSCHVAASRAIELIRLRTRRQKTTDREHQTRVRSSFGNFRQEPGPAPHGAGPGTRDACRVRE